MNKFTRSQMGKIMAYALSAAMAVTVVPTYMMKPLVAEAATTTGAVEYTNGQLLTATPTAAGANQDVFTIGLFKKTGSLTKADAVYLFEGVSDATNITAYIPYSVAPGSYYVGVSTTAGANSSLDDTQEFDVSAALTKINSASAATAIELSATDSNIYYNTSTGSTFNHSNKEILTTTVNGKYEEIQYTFKAKNKSGAAINVSDAYTVNINNPSGVTAAVTSWAATSVTLDAALTDSSALPTFTIEQKAVNDDATLEVEVTMKVTGRTKTYSRSYVFTSKESLTELTDVSLQTDKVVALVGDTATIKTSPIPATANENIEYSFDTTTAVTDADYASPSENTTWGSTWGSTATTAKLFESVNGKVHYLFAAPGNSTNPEYKSDYVLYATFDEETGELVAKKSGTYAIKAEGQASGKTKTVKVDMLSLATGTVGLNAGLTNETVATPITGTVGAANNSNRAIAAANYYVTYSVEDTDIAEIINQTNSLTQTLKVNTKSAGVTKINADILVYDTDGNTYSFTKSAYFVVAPKTTDKDFVLTDVPDTEVYVNALAETSVFSDALKLQAADAIIDGELDAKVLSYNAYSQINAKAVNKYTNHYDYTNTNDTSYNTTVTGMLFAAADPDFCALSPNDFDESVQVEYKVSELYGKDYVYKQDGSVIDFVAEMLVDNKVEELKQPVWITVTDASKLKENSTYTVYDNGEPIYVVKADSNNAITFQTDSFSVFSIVETPGAELTDNTVKLPNDDNKDSEDIYDLVNFSAHVQRRIGTDDEADIAATVSDDGIISLGTHGQSRRVEKITLTGLDADEVEMTAHVQKRVDHPEDVADLTQVVNEDGSISIGTEHQSRRIEAFSMNLKGDLAEKYDVYYRVHAQNYGWLGWAKNGEIAGTSGHSFRLEGIEIIFVEKGTEFDESQYVKTTEEGDRGYSEKAAYMDRVVSEK